MMYFFVHTITLKTSKPLCSTPAIWLKFSNALLKKVSKNRKTNEIHYHQTKPNETKCIDCSTSCFITKNNSNSDTYTCSREDFSVRIKMMVKWEMALNPIIALKQSRNTKQGTRYNKIQWIIAGGNINKRRQAKHTTVLFHSPPFAWNHFYLPSFSLFQYIYIYKYIFLKKKKKIYFEGL